MLAEVPIVLWAARVVNASMQWYERRLKRARSPADVRPFENRKVMEIRL